MKNIDYLTKISAYNNNKQTCNNYFFSEINDVTINGDYYLRHYLHTSGFLSINIYKLSILKEFVDKKGFEWSDMDTNWPLIVLAAECISSDSKVRIINTALIKKNDDNIIYGPIDIINLHILDIVKVLNYLKLRKISNINYSANYL